MNEPQKLMPMKKIILLFICLAFFTIKNQAQTVSDLDGNVYDTVKIGTQVWLKENLATTKYNDGTLIPLVKDSMQWIGLTTPGYCWYRNDSATYKNPYGALYNWYTVNTGKLCPTGWHVPSNAEWHTLILFLDPSATDCYCTESATAGDKLKEAGITHWGTGNTATNSSGFTAMPGGFRNYYDKNFEGRTSVAYFWSSTVGASGTTIWHRWMPNNNANIFEYLDQKIQGMSVRCLKDSISTGLNNINYENRLKIFPNPATDIININCTEKQIIKMQVYNAIGECVIQKELNNYTNQIDVSFLPKGIYVIKLTGVNWTEQHKLTKE